MRLVAFISFFFSQHASVAVVTMKAAWLDGRGGMAVRRHRHRRQVTRCRVEGRQTGRARVGSSSQCVVVLPG